MAELSTPEGTVHYDYDHVGALDSISYLGRTVSYDYDFFGRLSRAQSPEATWHYAYNASGQVTQILNQATGQVETRGYDGEGRLVSIEHARADGTTLFAIDYALEAGMRVGATETRFDPDADTTETVVWEYAYDRLGRLTLERRTREGVVDRDLSYAYDADGNRVAKPAHQT